MDYTSSIASSNSNTIPKAHAQVATQYRQELKYYLLKQLPT